MSAGLETTADLLSVPLEKTAGLLEGTQLPWMFLVTLTLKLGKNLLNKDMTKKEAVLDAIKGADAKLDEIKSMLNDIAAIGQKSFEFITDIRFKQGIERIAAAYQAFLNVSPSVAAWEAKMQQFEYHVYEHEKDYNQYMNPKRMEEYLKTLAAEENGIAKMVNALEFILATEAQYLHPMVNFYSYKEDPEAVTRQFQTFNQHVEFLNEVATKEIMKIVPACRSIRFANLCNFKMTNCPLLFKMIGKEELDEVEAACRHLSPRELLKLLNEPTEGSIMQYYAAGIVPGFTLEVREYTARFIKTNQDPVHKCTGCR